VSVNDGYNTSAGVAGPVAYWDVDDVDAVVAECRERGGTAHRAAVGRGIPGEVTISRCDG
jgi:hypothetical protein